MHIELKPNSKVYMLCPAERFTGGPEAIHQCVDMMRRCGHKAFIVYRPDVPDPTLRQYAHYDTVYAREVEDDPAHLLIAPEVMTAELKKYKRIRKAVWWLSAENHYKMPKKRQFYWDYSGNREMIHFAQSDFAAAFLRTNGVAEPIVLTEYLSHNYLQRLPLAKKDQVAYFARKSAGVIERLIAAAPDISWLPIQNMTAQQVREALAESKVYIDIGTHTGRDRMPREAAMQDCCIIVGNRGSAAFPGDIPVPEKYKVIQGRAGEAFQVADVDGVIRLIRDCLAQYDERIREFQSYRNWIVGQKDEMRRRIQELFGDRGYRGRPVLLVKARNYFVFYRNKVLKKLSGYKYVEEDD